MPDPNTIALVSVCVAGATAIAAPTLAGMIELRRERRNGERERRTADLADLRLLLDEASVALEEVRLHCLRQWRVLAGTDPGGATEARAQQERLIGASRHFMRLRARIMIRLGKGHAVSCACEEVVAALRPLLLLFDGWIGRSAASMPWDDADALERQLLAGCDRYVSAATAVVGSRLDD